MHNQVEIDSVRADLRCGILKIRESNEDRFYKTFDKSSLHPHPL